MRWARLFIVAAAVLFSTGGAAIKALHLTPFTIAAGRSLIAGVFLLGVRPSVVKKLTDARVWLVGMGYAVTMISYIVANRLTTAAATIFLQSTAPLYVLVGSHLFLGERARRQDILIITTIIAGIAILAGDTPAGLATAPRPMAGNLLGILAGVAWGATLLGLRAIARVSTPVSDLTLAAVGSGNIITVIGAGLLMVLNHEVITISRVNVAGLLFLGVVQVGLAYIFLTAGLRRVPAFEASILLMFEPLLNPLWTFIVHGETPGMLTWSGGAFILLGCVLQVYHVPSQRGHNPSHE